MLRYNHHIMQTHLIKGLHGINTSTLTHLKKKIVYTRDNENILYVISARNLYIAINYKYIWKIN